MGKIVFVRRWHCWLREIVQHWVAHLKNTILPLEDLLARHHTASISSFAYEMLWFFVQDLHPSAATTNSTAMRFQHIYQGDNLSHFQRLHHPQEKFHLMANGSLTAHSMEPWLMEGAVSAFTVSHHAESIGDPPPE